MALRHVATIHQYTPWRGSVRTFAEFYTKLIGLRGRFSAIRKTRPNQSDPTPRKQWLETVHDSPSLSLSHLQISEEQLSKIQNDPLSCFQRHPPAFTIKVGPKKHPSPPFRAAESSAPATYQGQAVHPGSCQRPRKKSGI